MSIFSCVGYDSLPSVGQAILERKNKCPYLSTILYGKTFQVQIKISIKTSCYQKNSTLYEGNKLITTFQA